MLTGAAMAVGLTDVGHALTPVGLAGAVTVTWLLLGLTFYSVMSDNGLSLTRASRLGFDTALVVVSLMGLVDLLPAAGWIIAGVLGLTSPWAILHVDMLMRSHVLPRVERSAPGPRPDQQAIDREFASIVRDLVADPSWQQDEA